MEHSKGFSPVWIRSCRARSVLLLKVAGQKLQLLLAALPFAALARERPVVEEIAPLVTSEAALEEELSEKYSEVGTSLASLAELLSLDEKLERRVEVVEFR